MHCAAGLSDRNWFEMPTTIARRLAQISLSVPLLLVVSCSVGGLTGGTARRKEAGAGEASTDGDAGGCGVSPSACAEAGAECGDVTVGACTFQCGACPPGQTCGGGGVTGKCGCQPKSCAELGLSCGLAEDGCGGTVDCGSCSGGELCSSKGQCVACQQGAACAASKPCVVSTMDCSGTPTCTDTGFVSAGTECGPGLTCDGKGDCVCTPTTCQALGVQCGTVPDGCGGTLKCPTCPSGEVCGASGQCSSCSQGAPCQASSPCKTASMDCSTGSGVCKDEGNTPAGTSCGAGQQCDGQGDCVCQPETCADLGKACGTWSNGCGGSVSCGSCGSGQVCNSSGQCVQCSQGASCTPSQLCHLGMVDCGSGQPVCNDAGFTPGGVSCGTGMVCDGSGNCIACTQGASCTLSNECEIGTTDCSTGAKICQQSGDQPEGTPCNTGAACPYECSTGQCIPLVGWQYADDGTNCTATAYYCQPNGAPPPPAGFSQYSPPSGCAYSGCVGDSCQENWCMLCPGGNCNNCPN
jgi:hypothetical protein